VRWTGVALAGVCAGLGGAYLALDQHQFTDGMTAGRGYIALAAVIFGRWDPKRVALACVGFAAAETLQIQLQGRGSFPSQFVEMIPYALTILAPRRARRRAQAPAALGRASERRRRGGPACAPAAPSRPRARLRAASGSSWSS
jgi:simple sugar transport system permease protein